MNVYFRSFYFLILAFSWCAALLGSPSVTQLDIASGPSSGGTFVTITGSDFGGVTAVHFGTTPAECFKYHSDSLITAKAPRHAPQVVPIIVTTSEGGKSRNTPESFFVYQGNWNVYIANIESNTVSITDASFSNVETSNVGTYPGAIALTPDGSEAYIANYLSNTVSVIDNVTFENISTINVGINPSGIAITPDGTKAFVSNYGGASVSIIDIASKEVVAVVPVGQNPSAIAITPDSTKAYVANRNDGNISVINILDFSVTNTIPVGQRPDGLIITSDGKLAYVSNVLSANVTVINTVEDTVATTISVGNLPDGIGLTPDGAKVYVANYDSSDVSDINTASYDATSIQTDGNPLFLAISPNGSRVYVANVAAATISVINPVDDSIDTIELIPSPRFAVTSGMVVSPDSTLVFANDSSNDIAIAINANNNNIVNSIETGSKPSGMAISPDQAPLAIFSFNAAPVGQASTFDASSSASPVGTIVNYNWDFGDGFTLNTPDPTCDHVYEEANVYNVSLTVTNSAGTSTQQIFTPYSVFVHFPFTSNIYYTNSVSLTHNGGPTAQFTQEIPIFYLPVVNGVSPNSGPICGGNSVIISGEYFNDVIAVFFGSQEALDFTITSDTTITATVPPGNPGMVNITVATPGRTSSISTDAQYTYLQTTIEMVSPNSGLVCGGNEVQISGENFTGATEVLFGSQAALSFTVVSNQLITAVAPPATAGTVDVIVQIEGCNSASTPADQYTYLQPVIAGVSPNSGTVCGGNKVQITGSNFTGATGVLFGSQAALSFTVVSNQLITAVAPPATAGTVDVIVQIGGCSSAITSDDQYTYLQHVIAGVSPNSGLVCGGNEVQITGANFTGATEVLFGLQAALSFKVVSDQLITAVAPPGIAGTVDVIVQIEGCNSATTSADQYTYLQHVIAGVSPNSGLVCGGNEVQITGANFTGATTVLFGSQTALSFTVVSDQLITAVAPPSTVGTVDVIVQIEGCNSATTSADQYTYLQHVIAGVSPNSGLVCGGNKVQITGANFTGATGVLFGSQAALSFTVVSDQLITAVAPPGTAGTVDIIVQIEGCNSATTSADQYTYLQPVILGVSPNSGLVCGGNEVQITGAKFTGVTGVLFGSQAALSFTVVSDRLITAVAPPATAGTVDVIVQIGGCSSASISADQYIYLQPTVAGTSPNAGTVCGGNEVQITGENLTGVTGVFFGSQAALSFTVVSDSLINAIAPPGAAGTVDVTVQIGGCNSTITSSDQYTYSQVIITTVTPDSGGTNGGNSVQIIGENFTGAKGVFFGSQAAISFTVVSDQIITAVVPPGEPGTVDVTVEVGDCSSSIVSVNQYFPNASARASADAPTTTTSIGQYTYLQLVPKVISLSPKSGTTSGGKKVRIEGQNFTGATAVFFGSQAALSFVVASDQLIVAVAPPGNPGKVDVTVEVAGYTNSMTSASRYTYLPPFPVQKLHGHQVKNEFAAQTDRVNILTWKSPSGGSPPIAYRIYRDTSLTKKLAVIPADGKLKFTEHNCKKRHSYHYFVVTVDHEGNLSEPAEIVVHPK